LDQCPELDHPDPAWLVAISKEELLTLHPRIRVLLYGVSGLVYYVKKFQKIVILQEIS
jgi:hypothetical protein